MASMSSVYQHRVHRAHRIHQCRCLCQRKCRVCAAPALALAAAQCKIKQVRCFLPIAHRKRLKSVLFLTNIFHHFRLRSFFSFRFVCYRRSHDCPLDCDMPETTASYHKQYGLYAYTENCSSSTETIKFVC